MLPCVAFACETLLSLSQYAMITMRSMKTTSLMRELAARQRNQERIASRGMTKGFRGLRTVPAMSPEKLPSLGVGVNWSSQEGYIANEYISIPRSSVCSPCWVHFIRAEIKRTLCTNAYAAVMPPVHLGLDSLDTSLRGCNIPLHSRRQ